MVDRQDQPALMTIFVELSCSLFTNRLPNVPDNGLAAQVAWLVRPLLFSLYH